MTKSHVLKTIHKMSKLKLAGIMFGGLVALALFLNIFSSLLTNTLGIGETAMEAMDSVGSSRNGTFSLGYAPPMATKAGLQTMESPLPNNDGYVSGNDAEGYESVSYDVTYKKGSIEKTCDAVESWKPLNYVVFEHAVRNDTYCSYRFKVEREHVSAILTEVQGLNPEEFTSNTETVKKQLIEYSDQLSILLRKQEILEKTLEDATSAYTDVMELAKQVEDVDALAKIIKNKTNDITLLTNERIALSQQIETLERQRAELSDRIEYVYFSLNIERYEVIDFSTLKDSWMSKVREFVFHINTTLQDLTLGVFMLFLTLLQMVLYIALIGAIAVVVAKFGWHAVRSFWNK